MSEPAAQPSTASSSQPCSYCGADNPKSAENCLLCGASLQTETQRLRRGETLAQGRYSIGRVLGEGGFGITYQGADLSLRRTVAIKELFPEGAIRQAQQVIAPRSLGTQGFAQTKVRFLHEARILARFNHDSIVRVQDVFEANNTAYLVMEFLQGRTLAALVQEQGALPVNRGLELIHNLAQGLRHVHRAKLLHRDIKPENILLTDSRVVLIDFGSARLFSRDSTVQHTRFVTPGYAPLEQYSSKARFGPYTDIYALAATLYYLLSARTPTAATDRVMHDNLQPLSRDIPEQVRDAIYQALNLKTKQRPQTVAAWLAMLEDKPAQPATENPPSSNNSQTTPTPSPTASPANTAPTNPAPANTTPANTSSTSTATKAPEEQQGMFRRRWLQGHSAWVSSLAFSPDGQYLASGGRDQRLHIWQVATGSLEANLPGHRGEITALCFNAEQQLISASRDHNLHLWQQQGTSWQLRYSSPNSDGSGLAISHEGTIIAGSRQQGRIVLLAKDDGRVLHSLSLRSGQGRSPPGELHDLSLNPDTGDIISASSNGSYALTLLRLRQDKLELTSRAPSEADLLCVRFSPDGYLIASAGSLSQEGVRKGDVRLWRRADAHNWHEPLRLRGHVHPVPSLSFSPDGHWLATADGNQFKLFDMRNYHTVRHALHSQSACSDGHLISCLCFAPQGRCLAVASTDASVSLWFW